MKIKKYTTIQRYSYFPNDSDLNDLLSLKSLSTPSLVQFLQSITWVHFGPQFLDGSLNLQPKS